MDQYKKERLRELFSSRQFIIVIVMLVVVVAVGGYYAYSLRQIGKIRPVPIETRDDNTATYTEHNAGNLPNDDFTVIPGGNYTQPNQDSNSGPVNSPETKPDDEVGAPVNQIDVTEAAPTVFSLPLGTDIGRDFSQGEMVFNSTMGDWRVHKGVDFQGAIGDTVKAVAAGTVKSVYDDPLWGTVMEIDHGGGILAKYCGLGKGSTLEVGAKVKMSDTIGNLGVVPIEKDDVDHLHFEVYVNGALKDPLEVLGRD